MGWMPWKLGSNFQLKGEGNAGNHGAGPMEEAMHSAEGKALPPNEQHGGAVLPPCPCGGVIGGLQAQRV